jgi:uncharacterized DUF497 family protein
VRLVVGGLQGFEWDAANWRKSELKHGVAATEAEEVLLGDPLCHVDTRHSGGEPRYVALGSTGEGRRLFISFTIRKNRIRTISARPMSRRERIIYDTAKATAPRR